jgi:hypothetical protein
MRSERGVCVGVLSCEELAGLRLEMTEVVAPLSRGFIGSRSEPESAVASAKGTAPLFKVFSKCDSQRVSHVFLPLLTSYAVDSLQLVSSRFYMLINLS